MKANNFGHNSQFKTIDDFIVNGRVKITKEIIEKYFKLNFDKDGQYIDSVFDDSECIGLRLRKRSNRNLTWYFERWNKKLNKPSKYKLLN